MNKREWQNSPIFTAPAVDIGPTNSEEHDVISMSEHIRSLESQLATANEACAAQAEALKQVASYTLKYRGSLPNRLYNLVLDGLSQTPAAVAQLAEGAAGFRRVKELVADIRERLTRQNCEPISILEELADIIAQAKAGEPCG